MVPLLIFVSLGVPLSTEELHSQTNLKHRKSGSTLTLKSRATIGIALFALQGRCVGILNPHIVGISFVLCVVLRDVTTVYICISVCEDVYRL